MLLDPAVTGLLATALALMFLVGAAQKLHNVPSFHGVLDSYALLPAALLRPTAWALPLLEAGAGLALLPERTRPAGAVLGLVLMVVVTAAIAINLMRGRADLSCGCGGLEDEQTLSWGLVLRNALLSAAIGLSGMAPVTRTLQWLDYLTVIVGGGALYGLYVVLNQLAANQPRLLRLRYST